LHIVKAWRPIVKESGPKMTLKALLLHIIKAWQRLAEVWFYHEALFV
jgi:hypothetical protein